MSQHPLSLFAHHRLLLSRCLLPLRGVLALALFLLLLCDAWAGGTSPDALSWGCRLRVRQAYIANGFDLDSRVSDDWHFLRMRSQLWGTWRPARQWTLHAMLNNEHRHWFMSNRGYENEGFQIHEFIFENLYLEWKEIGGAPLRLIVGRQNLFYGDGFVCWDGGPLDGSRTAYFNALLLRAELGKRQLDLSLISDPEKDEYLPVVNNQSQSLIEWNERGIGLYYTDESLKEQNVEAYYFYKNEEDSDGRSPESDIHTVGVRFSRKRFGRFLLTAEGATQAGNRGGQDCLGYGGSITGTYELLDGRNKWKSLGFSAGGFYLSGDKPATDQKYEGWNPVYARWPKWSELYIYTLANERGLAYWENIESAWLGLDVKAHERLRFKGRLFMMWAPEQAPTPGSLIFGVGDYRGTLSSVKLIWRMKKYLNGHFLWEALQPGTYYADGRDTAHFLRAEVQFTY